MPSVRFTAPDTDAYVDSVQRHIAEFTAETGIEAIVRIVPSDLYFSNDIHHLLEGEDAADVYTSGPVLLWEHIAAGYVEPLDDYLANASDTFDAADFFDALIASNRWTGRFGDPLGKGPLWEIPVNFEAYNLAYVPETLARLGVEPPGTWRQFFDAAAEVKARSRGAVQGFAQRGIQVWHTMYTGYATQFWTYGARDFDADGRCAIASPEGVAATTDFIDALRVAGPPDWLNQRWYELAMDFCADRYGFIVDSDHYIAFYEDAAKSAIKGRTGYALPPTGPGGQRASNMWTWSLVMNARSRNKQNAWRFIEWAAGKPFLLRSSFEGNMNPTRRSTWDSDRFRDLASGWGDFYTVARRLVEHDARVLVTPTPRYLRLADRWVRALRSAYAGDEGVAEALEAAAADIDRIVGETS
jgi:multiple sugar transport system substrate-binding protein